MDGAGHCEARARKGRGAQLLCGERTGDPARSECRGDGRGTAPPERWVLARGRVPAPPHVCRAEGAWQGFLASSWDRVTLLSPLKVVQSGGKNIELAIMRRDQPLKVMAAPAAALAGMGGGQRTLRTGSPQASLHGDGAPTSPWRPEALSPAVGSRLPSGHQLPRGAPPQGQLAWLGG